MTYKKTINDPHFLWSAATHGDCAAVKQLISGHDIYAVNRALRAAAENGYVECLEVLLPHSDPTDENSEALTLAAMRGHTDCVRMLLPVSRAHANSSCALQKATLNEHLECMKLLLPVSDPDIALRYLQWINPKQYNSYCHIEQIIAHMERNRLNDSIECRNFKNSQKRKM